MRLRLFAVVCVALLLGGCFGVSPSRKTGGDGKSYVKLTINWDSLDADPLVRPLSFTPMSVSEDVSVIGARVIAPDINALLAQSATRQTAETQGIITIPVPPTSNANLYAVASDDTGTPLMLGYLTGLSIAESTVLTVTTDELTWITPDAYFTGEIRWETPADTYTEFVDPELLETGVLTAPDFVVNQGCGQDVDCAVSIYIHVSDPFNTTPMNKMICLAGTHVLTPCHANVEHEDGWAKAALYCHTAHSRRCEGRAYVEGSSFLIPSGFFGPQFGPMQIVWQP